MGFNADQYAVICRQSKDDFMNDQIVWKGKPSWKGLRGELYLAIFLGLVGLANVLRSDYFVLIISALVFCFVVVYRKQYDFTVTNDRIIVEKGLWSKKTAELNIRDIRAVDVKQHFFARKFDTGDLLFMTDAGKRGDVSLKQIEKPYALQASILELKKQYKKA